MNWKHYLAIAAPYAAAAAIGVAEYMQHSSSALEITIGGLIIATLSHGNVLEHNAQKQEENKS